MSFLNVKTKIVCDWLKMKFSVVDKLPTNSLLFGSLGQMVKEIWLRFQLKFTLVQYIIKSILKHIDPFSLLLIENFPLPVVI